MAETGSGWKVVSSQPTIKFTPGGNGPTEGYDLSFLTVSGISGSVFIPTVQLADRAAILAAISERVAQLEAIHNLGG